LQLKIVLTVTIFKETSHVPSAAAGALVRLDLGVNILVIWEVLFQHHSLTDGTGLNSALGMKPGTPDDTCQHQNFTRDSRTNGDAQIEPLF